MTDGEPSEPDREGALPGLPVVIAGPSGVGKATVRRAVFERLPEGRLSVSATTRSPREGEVDGVDYHFVTRDEFQRLIDDDALLEWAPYVGNLYGTLRSEVEQGVAAGAVVFLDIEVKGALQIRRRLPGALLVFLLPPSFAELERRLRGRGTEDDEEIARRLDTARAELAQRDHFDLQVVNDDPDRCAGEILQAIDEARRAALGAGDSLP